LIGERPLFIGRENKLEPYPGCYTVRIRFGNGVSDIAGGIFILEIGANWPITLFIPARFDLQPPSAGIWLYASKSSRVYFLNN
jgi:hypothetical protein